MIRANGTWFTRLRSTGAVLALASICAASAAVSATQTFNITGSFSGGQLGDVEFDFTLTHDFSTDAEDQTAGLTVNSVTSSVLAGDPIALTQTIPGTSQTGYTFDYFLGGKLLTIGGGNASNLTSNTTDIRIEIAFPVTNATFASALDTIDTMNTLPSGVSRDSLSVTEVIAPVPLPATGWLLLGALAGAAAFRRRVRQSAS